MKAKKKMLLSKKKPARSKRKAAVVVSRPAPPERDPRFFKSFPQMVLEASAIAGLARSNPAALARVGWSPAETDAIEAGLRTALAEHGHFTAQVKESRAATAAFRALNKQALLFRDRLHGAFKVIELTDADLRGDRRLRRWRRSRPAKLILWFASISGLAEKHPAELQALLGQDPLAEIAAYLTKLTDALGAQGRRQASRKEISAGKRQAMYDLAVRVIRLRRVARIAFAGDKVLLRAFSQRPVSKSELAVHEENAAPADADSAATPVVEGPATD